MKLDHDSVELGGGDLLVHSVVPGYTMTVGDVRARVFISAGKNNTTSLEFGFFIATNLVTRWWV